MREALASRTESCAKAQKRNEFKIFLEVRPDPEKSLKADPKPLDDENARHKLNTSDFRRFNWDVHNARSSNEGVATVQQIPNTHSPKFDPPAHFCELEFTIEKHLHIPESTPPHRQTENPHMLRTDHVHLYHIQLFFPPKTPGNLNPSL